MHQSCLGIRGGGGGFLHAVYVHCNSHHLNLVLSAASKVFIHVSTFFNMLNALHWFMTGSSTHARFLEIQKELYPSHSHFELERSINIKWNSKVGSLSKVLILLDAILEVLAMCSEDNNSQTRIKAQLII